MTVCKPSKKEIPLHKTRKTKIAKKQKTTKENKTKEKKALNEITNLMSDYTAKKETLLKRLKAPWPNLQ